MGILIVTGSGGPNISTTYENQAGSGGPIISTTHENQAITKKLQSYFSERQKMTI